MRLRLCISPCRQPNLQLPAHMGALAGRLRGNRLGKVLPSFIWKRRWWSKKKEKKRRMWRLTSCNLFNATLRNFWDLRTRVLFNKGFEYPPPTPPHPTGVDRCSVRAEMKDLTEQRSRRLSAPHTMGSFILSYLFVFSPLLFHCNANTIKTNRELCRLPFKDTSHLPHVKF